MATTVAVVGAGAAVAAAGAQAYGASQQGKGGGGGPVGAGLAERIFNRGTRDVLNNERAVMQDALAQARFLQPEMYRALGYDPIYDERADANVAAFGQKVDDLQSRYDALQEERIAVKGKNKKAKLKKQARKVAKQLEIAQRQLGDAQTVGKRVVGIRKLSTEEMLQSGEPDDLFRVAFDLQNQTLVRALRGEEPIDATLKTTFEERERSLRDRLRNHLGPDYETSTAGQQALSNFAREKAEAFQQFNRETIKDFSNMTESRATALSNLTGSRLEQLLYPAKAQASLAEALGGVAKDRIAFGEFKQQERGLALKEREAADEGGYGGAPQGGAGMAGALSALGGGLTSLSGSGFLQPGGGLSKAAGSVANATLGREIAGPVQPGGASLGRTGGLAGALGGVFRLNR